MSEIEKTEVEEKERIKYSFWRKQWFKMELPTHYKILCLVGGVSLEFSSDIFTVQTFYEVADKTTVWFTIKGCVINASTIGWFLFSIGNDIAKSIMTPMAFQAYSKGLAIKATGCFMAGVTALTISHYATIASLASHYETEKNYTNEFNRHNKAKADIERQVDNILKNNNEIISQKNSIARDFQVMSKHSIKTKTMKMNKASIESNAAIKAQLSSAALLSQKLKSEKLEEVKKVDGISALYKSLNKMYFVNDDMTQEEIEKTEDKTRLNFQSFLSIATEIMGAILLTLGTSIINKKPVKRNYEEENKSEKNTGNSENIQQSTEEVTVEVTTKSPQSHHKVTTKSPQSPREVTTKSPDVNYNFGSISLKKEMPANPVIPTVKGGTKSGDFVVTSRGLCGDFVGEKLNARMVRSVKDILKSKPEKLPIRKVKLSKVRVPHNKKHNPDFDVDSRENKERFTQVYLEEIMQDISSGKLKSLTCNYLNDVYRCGNSSSQKIRDMAIAKGLAKKNKKNGRIDLVEKKGK